MGNVQNLSQPLSLLSPQELAVTQAKGFVQADVDPTLDLVAEINRLKREKNAVLLAHYYQDGDLQDIADFVGDSLGLAQEAAKTQAEVIVFAGVHFMAETAKLLNPNKKVLLPDLNAGCSLADSCPAPAFAAFKAKHPDHKVISYINCTAEIKALSDVIVTSSNARAIVESFPPSQPLIFAPDRNLGAYLNRVTGRQMLLWNGACMVHDIFSERRIRELMALHPEAILIAHPECEENVLQHATYIGSTTGLLKYVAASPLQTFIVATEPGILHQMSRQSPTKTLIQAPTRMPCACNSCPHMKLNTMEKLYLCLKYEAPEVSLPDDLMIRARKPIDKMLELSKQAGL